MLYSSMPLSISLSVSSDTVTLRRKRIMIPHGLIYSFIIVHLDVAVGNSTAVVRWRMPTTFDLPGLVPGLMGAFP